MGELLFDWWRADLWASNSEKVLLLKNAVTGSGVVQSMMKHGNIITSGGSWLMFLSMLILQLFSGQHPDRRIWIKGIKP